MKTNEEIKTIVKEFFNDEECELYEINIIDFAGRKNVGITCGTISWYSITLLNEKLKSSPVIFPNDKEKIDLDYWLF